MSSQSVRGVAWTAGGSLVARGVGLVGTLLLVRYLAPDDYGVVSAASVVVASAGQLSTLGIGIYLVAHPRAGREVAFHATVIHMVLGTVALGLVLALSGPLGAWLGAPTIGRYLPGLALALMLDRLAYVPERILFRSLRFRVVGVARSGAELVYTAVSVGAAIAGWGGGAMVAGNVARSLVRAVLLVGAADRRDWLEPSPIRLRTLRALAGYGVTVSVGSIAAFASRRWDNLLISRFFGPAVMGSYNVAYNLADVPAVQVGEQITDVLFASFAAMEEKARRATLVRSVRLLALLLFPLAVGLGAIAPTLSATFFSSRWSAVASMLAILATLSISRPIGLAVTSYLQAQRRPATATALELLGLVFLVTSLGTFGRLGPLHACVAVGVAFGARTLAALLVLKVTDGVPLGSLASPLVRPLLACGPMVAAVLAARIGVRHLDLGGHGVGLVLETLAGAIAYLGAASVLARDASSELLRLLRRAVARAPRPGPGEAPQAR